MFQLVKQITAAHSQTVRLTWESINSGLDYWNGGMVDWIVFCPYFHCLSHYIYPVVFPLNFLNLNLHIHSSNTQVKSHEP